MFKRTRLLLTGKVRCPWYQYPRALFVFLLADLVPPAGQMIDILMESQGLIVSDSAEHKPQTQKQTPEPPRQK